MLEPFKNTHIHEGIFQDFTQDDIPDQIALAFLDGELHSAANTTVEHSRSLSKSSAQTRVRHVMGPVGEGSKTGEKKIT